MRNLYLRARGCLIAILILSLFSLAGPDAWAWSAPPLLRQATIDETDLVPLVGNTRSAAREPRNDRGLVDDTLQLDHMFLLLRRPAASEARLGQLLDAMYTPGSPEFHHWLTAEAFGTRFGAAPEDIGTVTDWLASHGLMVQAVYADGTMIDFSGSAGQVREAFHTQLHNLVVGGERHIANVTDPEIPAALGSVIRGIVSLNDFRPHALHRDVMAAHMDPSSGKLITASPIEAAGNASSSSSHPDYTFSASRSTYQAVTPADLETIYNLDKLYSAGYSGQGQTIALIENSNVYATADWTTFRSTFGLTKYAGTLTQVHPGNCSNPGVTASDREAILDAEYASASAPSAAIELASCADSRTTFGGLIALANLVNTSRTPPAIISLSYGECEAENGATANALYSAVYQQAAAEGISVFVASGDEGAAGCDASGHGANRGINVNGFASTAYNVAVGGTDFGDTYAGTTNTYWNATNSTSYASAKSYINEIPWNDSCASVLLATAATGSGVTYGSRGFCNTSTGEEYYLNTTSTSGGPSSCFTGQAAVAGVVSGSCKGNPKPAWQAGLAGVPADGVRDLPDVSLFAGNGAWGHYYVYCFSDVVQGGKACKGPPSAWSGAGGTSFASPIMAGIQAIVNQKTGARQGNPNPVYYKLAGKEYGLSGSACDASRGNGPSSTCIFYDVTQGDMDVNCTGTQNCYRPAGSNGVLSISSTVYKPAYSAGAGFDLATGIGSVNAFNLVSHWFSAITANSPLLHNRNVRSQLPARN